jgi:hypothetical protein
VPECTMPHISHSQSSFKVTPMREREKSTAGESFLVHPE